MKRYFKYLLIPVIIAFAASCSSGDDDDGIDGGNGGGTNPPPSSEISLQKKELRAVWMATVWSLDWPKSVYDATSQKRMYTDYLDKFAVTNVNAVFVQIRPNADAFYNSQYEPWSRWITGVAGKNPGYDVLNFMITEAHARGLEFHAWMNPYRIATRSSTSEVYPALDTKINPDWVKSYDKIQMYNPARPEAQVRIVDIVKDVITKYDVDGIHFDDYFYPDPTMYTSLNDDADYTKYGNGYADLKAFRRGNVDKIVKNIYDIIVKEKPGVVFSISPTADNEYNYNSLYADVTKWCKEGWVDIIIPQLYSATGSASSSFNTRVSWWPVYSYKAIPVIGYGLYKFGNPDEGSQYQTTGELIEQFRLANAQSKIQGSVMYSAKYFNENKLGVIDVLKNQIYKTPSVIPFAGRKTVADPASVSNITINSNKLKWNTSSGLRTVIYKLSDKKGTVVTVTSEKEYTLAEKGDYCMTTLNDDNMESAVSDIVSYK